jgi:hypothetical protein
MNVIGMNEMYIIDQNWINYMDFTIETNLTLFDELKVEGWI